MSAEPSKIVRWIQKKRYLNQQSYESLPSKLELNSKPVPYMFNLLLDWRLRRNTRGSLKSVLLSLT